MSTKICTKCGENKELTEFYKRKQSEDGLRSACKTCARAYRQANKTTILAYASEYYQANKEAIITKNTEYYETNKVELAAQKAEYYQTNKVVKLTYASEYRQINKVAIAAKKYVYRQTPKGKLVSANSAHKRRAVVKSGSVSTKELQQLVDNNIYCFYCGCEVTDDNRHIDHFIPLCKGGLHDIQNLVVACATCNMKKGDKMPEEFMARQLENLKEV